MSRIIQATFIVPDSEDLDEVINQMVMSDADVTGESVTLMVTSGIAFDLDLISTRRVSLEELPTV